MLIIITAKCVMEGETHVDSMCDFLSNLDFCVTFFFNFSSIEYYNLF